MTRRRQQSRPYAGSGGFEATYNLFRRKLEPDLHCAVPQDHRVPDFIGPDHWSYEGTIQESSGAPLGFRTRPARLGVRLNGFYLFHAHQVRPRITSVDQVTLSPPRRLATAVKRARRPRLQAARQEDGPSLGTHVGAQVAGSGPRLPVGDGS